MCMRGRRYRWVLVLTACVLIGMSLPRPALFRPDLPETVPAIQAAKEDVYNTVSVKGTVRAKRESQEFVYAPARVEVCYVSLGETVEAGQPLIQVYYPEVPEEVQQAATAFFEETANASPEQAAQNGTIVRASMDGTVAQLPEEGDSLPGVTAVRIGDFSDLSVEAKVPELYAADLEVGQRANITSVAR